MKKLICLVGALMLIFTACGNNAAEDNMNDARDGVVQDRDGIIDEDYSADGNNIVNDAADGTKSLVDGAANATKDAIGGVENAADNMMGTNKNNNSKNAMK